MLRLLPQFIKKEFNLEELNENRGKGSTHPRWPDVSLATSGNSGKQKWTAPATLEAKEGSKTTTAEAARVNIKALLFPKERNTDSE